MDVLLSMCVGTNDMHYTLRREESFLETDWFDGDLVFAASICFSQSTLSRLFLHAEKLRPGSKLVTAKLPDIGYDTMIWKLERTLHCEMSWGRTEFFVLLRNIDVE
jgi:hypothetical protein